MNNDSSFILKCTRFLIKLFTLGQRNRLMGFILLGIVLVGNTLLNLIYKSFNETVILQFATICIIAAWYGGAILGIASVLGSLALINQYFVDSENNFSLGLHSYLVFIPAILIMGFLVVIQRRAVFALNRLALHDYLTGLSNRRLLREKLDLLIELAKRKNELIGILYLDLDRFKEINDNFGHEAGDEALKVVAEVLKKHVREADVICRYGGDEFVVVLSGLNTSKEARLTSKRILDSFNQSFEIADKSIYISVSIGISIFPYHGTLTTELLREADKALHLAKERGKCQYALAGKIPKSENTTKETPW